MAQSDRRRERGVPKGASDDSAKEPSRRLAAIMFTDLVGYSALAHRDEDLAIEQLEMHRGWVREILPRYGGVEIETVGDAFLIEFAGALAAVECAVAIQRRFEEHNAAAPVDRRMELRIGVHLGDVEHRGDKVFGDGVNIASRIHGMARPGGICVSEDVHHAVRNRPAFQFASLGSPPLKNITTALELFELAPSLSLAPPADVAAGRVQAAVQHAAAGSRRWLPVAVAAGGAVLALAALAGWFLVRPPPSSVPAIAVLPFDNLSAEADSAFFTDGLHDTVIGHLSRVRGIKVISRTSVMGYRGQKANLRRIAQELGVTSILEGSVQRSGNRLRVAAQLIDTATDTHLWSNEYSRELKDVFEVQADIAQQVANAVQVKLTPQEQASLESVPTRNAAAYDLYLRAVLASRSAVFQLDKAREGIGLLDQAIALDPAFAPAYALRSSFHNGMHWFGHDASTERRRRAGEDADRALALDPRLVEAHLARAMHLYHGSRNYEAALKELEVARGLAPGNADALFWTSMIYRRQGRWNEAVATLERTTSLDPLNPQFLHDLGETLVLMRRYDEASARLARLVHLDPGDPGLPVWVAYNDFLRTGDLAPLEMAVAAVPPAYDPGCEISLWRWNVAFYQRRYAAAAEAMGACKEALVQSSAGEPVPKDYLIARAQWLASGRKASPLATRVRAQFEQTLAARPELPGTRLGLAYMLVMLGEREQALAEVDRALTALPVSRDALFGAQMLVLAAEIRANAGAEAQALDTLGQALRLPNGGNVEELRRDGGLDPLRNNPRFEQILAQASRT